MESNSPCLSLPRHSALGETLNLAHRNLCLVLFLLSSHRLFTVFLLFQRDRCGLFNLRAGLIVITKDGLQKTGVAIRDSLFVPLTMRLSCAFPYFELQARSVPYTRSFGSNQHSGERIQTGIQMPKGAVRKRRGLKIVSSDEPDSSMLKPKSSQIETSKHHSLWHDFVDRCRKLEKRKILEGMELQCIRAHPFSL